MGGLVVAGLIIGEGAGQYRRENLQISDLQRVVLL